MASGPPCSLLFLSFLSFLRNHLGFFNTSFLKNAIVEGLSCLLFSRFCDVASFLVVCELPWRFGFWFPALLRSLSLLLSAANESITMRKSESCD
jgi:hypothetical protein